MTTCTPEQAEQIRQKFTEWLERLRMQNWKVIIDTELPAAEDSILEVYPIKGMATVRVHIGSYFESTPAARENAVCHELLHGIFDPLWRSIEAVLAQLSPQSERMMTDVLKEQAERLVDHLSHVMAHYDGPCDLAEAKKGTDHAQTT